APPSIAVTLAIHETNPVARRLLRSRIVGAPAMWSRQGLVCALVAAQLGCSPEAGVEGSETSRDQGPDSVAARSGGLSATSSDTAGFDIGDVVRRAHFAFRSEARSFIGTHDTHTVRVDEAGRIAFSPRWSGQAGRAPRGADSRVHR